MAGKKRSRNSSADAVGVDVESAAKSVGEDVDSTRPQLARARGAWQSEERISALVALLENGIPLRAACASLRIPETSLRQRMAADEELESWINDARAAAEARHVAKVANADDWKASAWWLERRGGEEWAPPVKRESREVSGPDGGPVRVAAVDVVTRMSDAELAEAARTLLGSGE